MKKVINLLIVVCFMVVLLPAAAFAHTESDPFVTDLIAGQYYDAGDVLVWNDAETLYVVYLHSYTGDEEWKLTGTHLNVCKPIVECPDCIPQTKKGNPPPGQFNYNVPNFLNSFVAEYEIPLEEISAEVGDILCIAAHAEVDHYVRIEGVCTYVGSETAWAKGDDFPGKNWAMYFTYEVQEVVSECEPQTCGNFTCDCDPDHLGVCCCFATDPDITTGACVDDYWCTTAEDCSVDPCPAGKQCLYQTCCGPATCGPMECTGTIQGLTVLGEGLTASGN